MRRLIAFFVVLILVLSLLPLAAIAATTYPEDSYYSGDYAALSAWGPITTQPSYPGGDAGWGTATTAVLAWKHPSWPMIAGSEAKWISTSFATEPPYIVCTWRKFELAFSLPANATDISSTLKVTSDNAEAVYLNGALVGSYGEVWGTFADDQEWSRVTTYNPTPTRGANTLTFIVRNYAGGSNSTNNPTGLIFDFLVEYTVPNSVPQVNLGEAVIINEGGALIRSGSFTDPDHDSWTATVDYGLGDIPDVLVLNADKTFELSCTYPDNGLYTVTVRIYDGEDDGFAELSVTVNNLAPVVGEIAVQPASIVSLGTAITAGALFTDAGVEDTHDAVWDWGDGNTSAVSVTQGAGSGSVTGSHTYAAAGVYTVTLTVTDNDGDSGNSTYEYVVVYDPDGGFVTGGGWIWSPKGAYAADEYAEGKATFGFVSRYQRGASVPTGNTQFVLHVDGGFTFHSTSYEWLVISGARAQYKGVGRLNGADGYGFMLSAVDGDMNGDKKADQFRIKIWDADEKIVYDNLLGADDSVDDLTALGGGSIVVHTPPPAQKR